MLDGSAGVQACVLRSPDRDAYYWYSWYFFGSLCQACIERFLSSECIQVFNGSLGTCESMCSSATAQRGPQQRDLSHCPKYACFGCKRYSKVNAHALVVPNVGAGPLGPEYCGTALPCSSPDRRATDHPAKRKAHGAKIALTARRATTRPVPRRT